jgi:hypothetical protein
MPSSLRVLWAFCPSGRLRRKVGASPGGPHFPSPVFCFDDFFRKGGSFVIEPLRSPGVPVMFATNYDLAHRFMQDRGGVALAPSVLYAAP